MNEWIPIARPSFSGNEKKYLLDAVESGWISSIGKYIDHFEQSFSAYHHVKHAVATHNGTIALHLALAALDIGEGDEVIVPDLTFIATANSVRYCNAIPVLCDVDPDTWNISVDAAANAITPRTRAIIPVHLYGNPAQMEAIMELAHKYGLAVIEDCAESLGASIAGRKTGTFGHISCFSFFGNKVITTGEGGMCITGDDTLAERMRILRDHGMNRKRKYQYDHLGFNYRMTNMQGAVGLAQLEQLDGLLAIRNSVRLQYDALLAGDPLFAYQEAFGNETVNWIYTLRLKGFTEEMRDSVMSLMREDGIDTRPVFYPIHTMPFYRGDSFSRTDYPHSRDISAEGISLPTFTAISDEEIRRVCHSLRLATQTAAKQ